MSCNWILQAIQYNTLRNDYEHIREPIRNNIISQTNVLTYNHALDIEPQSKITSRSSRPHCDQTFDERDQVHSYVLHQRPCHDLTTTNMFVHTNRTPLRSFPDCVLSALLLRLARSHHMVMQYYRSGMLVVKAWSCRDKKSIYHTSIELVRLCYVSTTSRPLLPYHDRTTLWL